MVNNKNFKAMSKSWSLLLVFVATAVTSACAPSGEHRPIDTNTSAAVSRTNNKTSNDKLAFADVREIFANRCTECHKNGDKNWNDPQSAEKWAKNGAMGRALKSGYMPLKGSPQASAITADEKKKLLDWIDSVNGVGGDLAAAPAKVSASVVDDKNIAFVARCMTCHGPTGTSGNDMFPNIASHGPDYFVARINEYLDPKNQTVMGMQIKTLAEEFTGKATGAEWDALVQYAARFFTLAAVDLKTGELESRRQSLDAANKQLYDTGKKLVAERCLACHLQADMRPMANAAMIFGQKQSYLNSRLQQFKAGAGGNVMPAMVAGLSQAELEAIALYLSHTAPEH